MNDFFLYFVSVWFEPTDVRLVHKLLYKSSWKHLTYASPNINELQRLHEVATGRDTAETSGTPALHYIFMYAYIEFIILYNIDHIVDLFLFLTS